MLPAFEGLERVQVVARARREPAQHLDKGGLAPAQQVVDVREREDALVDGDDDNVELVVDGPFDRIIGVLEEVVGRAVL